jgi:hypothetical protein
MRQAKIKHIFFDVKNLATLTNEYGVKRDLCSGVKLWAFQNSDLFKYSKDCQQSLKLFTKRDYFRHRLQFKVTVWWSRIWKSLWYERHVTEFIKKTENEYRHRWNITQIPVSPDSERRLIKKGWKKYSKNMPHRL